VTLLAAMTLVTSACGTDPNVPAYVHSTKVDCGGKQSLAASGSTAQANAMTHFIDVYQHTCPGQSLTYTSNGSGAGVREFVGNETDFGGSDSPLTSAEAAQAEQRCGSPAWNLPVVFGPIAVTYNLDGVPSLVLDGPTTAKIFNGAITTWDDPALKALNPGAALPSQPIRVIYRSDESGTTDNFQQYLQAASDGAWDKGVGKTFKGGVGEAAAGNEGTSATVRDTDGAISYNEWSYAKARRLTSATMKTPASPDPVPVSADTVGRTIAEATIKGQGNDLVLDTSSFYLPTQPGAYPIVLATYELVCSEYPDADTGKAVRAFLQSTVGPGQFALEDSGYFPLPEKFQTKVADAVNAIT
jgi:phosphate transport system substrate-binding protein